ncbi:PTR2-domain-containing protein [Linderina pennispora]|uniref:PTR2-domain-containing protein n=1 Tax=Linderina pennispora TaxID=61395 RepID=A0A1Y1WM74_9FUNG|nr:PTR2-domain-containing protein [Linderina pennispora]ORX74388.1 PTR2-domain-containing protein [Linderina pennispora]
MFFVGIVVFVGGSKKYVKKQPQGTVLVKVWRCMKYARANKREGQAHWLDGALNAEGQEWDDDLRACKVFLFYPLYWALYNNMSDNFINQGMTMERPDWLSVDQLNVINSLVLVISIPIFDNFVFPMLRRCGLRLGPIARITTGFVIVVCGFIYVTVLQKIIYTKGPNFDFSGPDIMNDGVNHISVWYQIVPYAAVAISEIFASVTGLEFAFSQAPSELKSVLTAVLYPFLGVLAVVFYFCFRHYDDIVAEQEQFRQLPSTEASHENT